MIVRCTTRERDHFLRYKKGKRMNRLRHLFNDGNERDGVLLLHRNHKDISAVTFNSSKNLKMSWGKYVCVGKGVLAG